MRLYQPTIATHLMSAAIASAFGGGGLAAVLHASMGYIGIVVLAPVALGVGAILAAIGTNQTRAAVLMAALSGAATYAFIITDILVMSHYRRLGWLMLAIAALTIAQALFASALATGSRRTHRASGPNLSRPRPAR